jgi:hypothetical protein
MKDFQEQVGDVRRQGGMIRFFKKIGSKIAGLFEPEEVEVTFKTEGKKVSYTYTKVNQKQVA